MRGLQALVLLVIIILVVLVILGLTSKPKPEPEPTPIPNPTPIARSTPNSWGPQWSAQQFSLARENHAMGYLLLYDDLQFSTANSAEADQDYADSEALIKRVAAYYNVSVTVVKVPVSKLFLPDGTPTPEVSNPLYESIVRNFNTSKVYRVVMPPFSSSLGPWLRGDYAGDIPVESRFSNTIFAVENPGTTEVENNSNVWRFLDTGHDTNGSIAGSVYLDNLAPGGQVLIVHTSTGIDFQIAQEVQGFLEFLGVPSGDIILFPITPSGPDYSPATYASIAAAVAALPSGSIVAYCVNNPIEGSTFGPSADANGGIFIAANGNGPLTHVGQNYSFDGTYSLPVDVQFGLGTGSLAGPTMVTRRFGLSDSLDDSLNGIGLWRNNVGGTSRIQSTAWLASRGLFEGAYGDILFVGQSLLNPVVYSQVAPAGSTIVEYQIVGMSSWYFDTANVDVPGTWSILFSPLP